jgi:hypothetical protein
MTFPKTLNTKVAVNELIFPMVTHTVYSEARCDSYKILKSGHGAENFLNRQDRPANDQVLGQKMHESWQGLFTNSVGH